jgi:hypothetical protein
MYQDSPKFRLFLYRQYSQEYGELALTGEYQIGEKVQFHVSEAKGIVAWKHHDQKRGLLYIVEDSSGFPFQIPAHEIVSKL